MLEKMNSIVKGLNVTSNKEYVGDYVVIANTVIRESIISNKDVKSTGLSEKQLVAIFKLYASFTGKLVSQKQNVYLHTITSVQAVAIINELNALNKVK